MKEVLTKSFWKDVKKTFDEALEGPPPTPSPTPPPNKDAEQSASPTPETSTPPEQV